MDLLLLFVLSGVTLAFGKRIYSQAMGMHRTTRHVLGDRIALSVLWLIFPARLLAESITCALHGGGGFLTGTIGEWMAHHVNPIVLQTLYEPLWWAYSICLGLFFIVLPFSRYMHIFTEIPLIFLRRYKLHSTEKEGSFDRFRPMPARGAASASTLVSCRANWGSTTCSRSISCVTGGITTCVSRWRTTA